MTMNKDKADFQTNYRDSINHDHAESSELKPDGDGNLKKKDGKMTDTDKEKIHDAMDKFIEKTEQIDKE